MVTADVVIPTYNRPASLRECVASALGVDAAARVIVVDDASSPPVTLADVAGGDERGRVTLLRQDVNAGPAAARNRGLEASSAACVVFLDADDMLLPGLGAALECAERSGAAAVVSARIERLPDGTERLRGLPAELDGKPVLRPADVFRPLALFSTSGIVVTRRVIEAGVRFDESLRHGEDREFLRRAAEVGPVVLNPEPVVRFTIHGAGGDNLNAMRHLPRRIENFSRIAARWHDAESDPHLRAAACWLANQAAKQGCDGATWAALSAVFRRYGWAVPLKARVRAMLRRGSGVS